MKKAFLIVLLCIISHVCFAQWTTSGSNIYFNTGNVGIGTTSPSSLLSLGGNPNPLNAQQLGILYSLTANSGLYSGLTSQITATSTANTTAAFYGIYSQAATAASSTYNFSGRIVGIGSGVAFGGTGVASGIAAFYAFSPTLSSTGTVTDAYGININPQRVARVSGAFGVYQSGATDTNYFAGDISVGAIYGNAKLSVTQNIGLGSVAKNNSLITSMIGLAGNHFQDNIWLVRNSAGTDWTTARLHDGISIDATYTTPEVNTRTWWERDPHANIQSWGSDSTTYFSIVAGKVGVNTTYIPAAYQFAVNGAELATSVTVLIRSSWPDYVFKQSYKLPLLTQVKSYIDKNHHLPDLPSANDVAKNGLNLGEINQQLTKKVEELTLYMIDKDQQLKDEQSKIKAQDDKLSAQQEQIDQMKQQLKQIAMQLKKPKS